MSTAPTVTSRFPWSDLLTVLLTAIALIWLWTSPWLAPLKILIVLFHELSHALMTIITGGEVVSLELSSNQGGMVLSRGGSRFLILSAGYLGSLLFGCVLFLLARGSRRDGWWTGLLAVLLLATALWFARNSFALVFSLGAAACLAITARWGGAWLNDQVLKVVGIASMLYAPADIISDTLLRAHLRSDARMLAEEFGGFTQFWGLLWLVISVLVIGATLWTGLRGGRTTAVSPAGST
ncbi:MAG: M50 family metallopeptidase [Xanthomonadales bacterium]|nr:M50 family metallopeptidase [Xanthomonadales bacterium]MCB1627236.1 M50 family metallopeptidase [Xanthomonadales bacterium]